MAQDGKDRFQILRIVQLDDESYDGTVRYPFAQCRLTHVDGREFEEQEGDDPAVGFLNRDENRSDQDRLTRLSDLGSKMQPFALALDHERLEELLKAAAAQFQGGTLTLALKLQRITRHHAVAREMAVIFEHIIPNPFRRDDSASETPEQVVEDASSGATGQPDPAAAEDQAAARRFAPAAKYKADEGYARLLVCAAELGDAENQAEDWKDASTLIQSIAASVPVLETWLKEDFPLLMVRIESSQPYRRTTVTFASRLSKMQCLTTGLTLMQRDDLRHPLQSRIFPGDEVDENGTVEVQWSWTIEPGRIYVLHLTSRSEWLPSPFIPFNPAAPFTDMKAAGLQPLKMDAWLDGRERTRRACLWVRPTRTSRGGGSITKAELSDFVAMAVSPARRVHVVHLGGKTGKVLDFVVEGAVPASLTIRQLVPDADAVSSLILVAFQDNANQRFRSYHRDGATRWSATLHDHTPDFAVQARDFTVTRNLLVTNQHVSTIIPVKVTFKSRRPLTVLAIDVGASAIAVAIASTESPTDTAVLLPIGKVKEYENNKAGDDKDDRNKPRDNKDRADRDANNPDVISAYVGVSISPAPRGLLAPWHVQDVSADPRLRDADAELLARPNDEHKVRKRLSATASNDFPGRRIEVHLQVLRLATDEDGVRVIEDLKMTVCRKEWISNIQPIVARISSERRSSPNRLRTADLLEHVIELILSIYAPDAADIGGLDPAGFESAHGWDALFDDSGRRHFVLALSHPASIDNRALARYRSAAREALLQHFGPAADYSKPYRPVSCRNVSEALAVDAALRHVSPRWLSDSAENSGRRRVVIDIGSATTDVAVIAYDKRGGWGEVTISFALPIAAASFRRWIAQDIREAASLDIRKELPLLDDRSDSGKQRLDENIEDAICNSSDQQLHLTISLAEGPVVSPALPEIDGDEDDGKIRFRRVDERASKPEFVAFVPIYKTSASRNRLIFHHGLDVLATLIAKGVASAFSGRDFDAVEIVLSGRGAAFEPVGYAIQAEIKNLDHRGELRVATVGELLCPDGDKAAKLRKMKSVVAEGAAARALAIETGFAAELLPLPAKRHVIVRGFVDSHSEPLVFDRIVDIYPLDPPLSIQRAGQQLWVARIVPGLKTTDIPALVGSHARTATPDGTDGVEIEIARACIVPVRNIGRGADSIEWTVISPDSLMITDSNGGVEPVRLLDDGSYA
jgi:hypothetical protein